MTEKVRHQAGYDPDTERTRQEVVLLLQSILGEVTVQAHGAPPPLHPAARDAIRAYEEMQACLALNVGIWPAR
ncbi:MAG TPA: hypothetical protein VH855_11855 [Acetobacteraceae bacterium]|jgi:hypothetical protein